MTGFLERWNPTVKAGTVLVCVILLSVQYLVSLNLAVFGVCLVLLLSGSRCGWRRVAALLLPACLAALGLFVMGLYYARGGSVTQVELDTVSAVPYAVRAAMSHNLYTALQLATRLLAYAGLGMLFALSTDAEFFIASLLHQCRLSPKFAYGILAAFHLMPGMVREFSQVRLAFAVRGLHVHPLSLKPIFTMLVNSVHWSESVSMAMESKGFAGNAPRSYYTVPRVHWYDLAGAALAVGGIVLGMLLLHY
ncbi:energy-coupling factor transporter transmembrane protein EcfT [uncultured Gemmiger sp.]|uniref:energy-coupling factor transporter transmembrane component T family protein n=1 Tax=uncultured Gemmiger sp. TaxID=1623490 RepID=UPI0025F44C0E|nr:energy-coupling factor transporter transmembrane component T [uncultured Gemmiger sp.]